MSEPNNKGFNDTDLKIIDIHKIFVVLGRRWHFIVISLLISIIVTYIKVRYTKPLYEAQITIKLDDEKPNQISDFFKFGRITGKLENFLKTESEIIKSRALNEQTLHELGYNFSYFQKGNIVTTELYPNNYFEIICHYNDSGNFLRPFNINFTDDNTFEITTRGDKHKTKHHLNDTIFIDNSLIEVRRKQNPEFFNLKGFSALCVQNDLHALAYKISSHVNIDVVKGTSLINISYVSDVPELASDFINLLANVYINETIRLKSQAAQQTIDFINNQLDELSEKVKKSEFELSNLQSQQSALNSFTGISTPSTSSSSTSTTKTG